MIRIATFPAAKRVAATTAFSGETEEQHSKTGGVSGEVSGTETRTGMGPEGSMPLALLCQVSGRGLARIGIISSRARGSFVSSRQTPLLISRSVSGRRDDQRSTSEAPPPSCAA